MAFNLLLFMQLLIYNFTKTSIRHKLYLFSQFKSQSTEKNEYCPYLYFNSYPSFLTFSFISKDPKMVIFILTFTINLPNLICSILYFYQNIKESLTMETQIKRSKRSITTSEKNSTIGSNKIFDPELELLPKRNFKFQSFTTKTSIKSQKLTVDRVIEKILFALQTYYQNDKTGFLRNCRDFLTKGWDSWKLKIIDRMNTYEYVEMAIKHKRYSEIEAQIMKEWKKNYLLFGIMTFWYNSVEKFNFQTTKQFQRHYNIFREFIAQITYFIFKGWLNNLEKKNRVVLQKLYEEASHFIITQSSEFKKVYEKTINPLILLETKHQQINWQFKYKQLLQYKKCIYSPQRQTNLPKTKEAIRHFTKQIKLSKKIESLRQIRKTLEQQIIAHQQQQILNKQKNTFQILEKDDFLNSLIYCIIEGEIHDIQSSMVYLVVLLGEDLSLLSKMQLGPYAIDLIAAIDYLSNPFTNGLKAEKYQTNGNQHRSLYDNDQTRVDSADHEKEPHIRYSFIKKLQKIQSSPLIQQQDCEQFLNLKLMESLTTKKISFGQQI